MNRRGHSAHRLRSRAVRVATRADQSAPVPTGEEVAGANAPRVLAGARPVFAAERRDIGGLSGSGGGYQPLLGGRY